MTAWYSQRPLWMEVMFCLNVSPDICRNTRIVTTLHYCIMWCIKFVSDCKTSAWLSSTVITIMQTSITSNIAMGVDQWGTDNKPSHWVLPPGHWRLKLKICRLHANMCKFDAEIKSYKDGKTIWIYHNHYLPCTYNSKRCPYLCKCYYYDRAATFQ